MLVNSDTISTTAMVRAERLKGQEGAGVAAHLNKSPGPDTQ